MAKNKSTRVECPHCCDWKPTSAGQSGKGTGFTLDGVTWHYAPDMWLASRSARYGGTVEAMRKALADWTVGCECQARIEAQRAERAA